MATSPLASPGIGSGLDIGAIVEKLMSIERRPLDALAKQQAAFQSKISAYGTLKSALAALQSAVAGLNSSGTFRTAAATLSDQTLATVSAGSAAVPGSHSIEVTSLAQAHRIASAGFASTADTVGTGTLTFTFGTWSGGAFTPNATAATGSVTIAAGQSSLAGIRDAVNAAKIGVTASIVDDGTAAGQRLVFTSSSGAAMSLKVGVTDADGNALDAAGLSQLAYDPAATPGAGRNMSQTVQAKDAALTVDGIDIVKPTNVITDAIAGVTLTLSKTNIGSPATLTLAPSPGAALASLDAFVKAYNDVQRTITALTKYDTEKKQGSVLTGDATVRTVQSQLRALIGGAVAGGSGTVGELATLIQAGVKTQSDGTLTLDTAKFSELAKNDPAAVERLFASVGTATDALVRYSGATTKTQVGQHSVEVTRLATRGTLVANAAASLTITAGVNDTLTATIDGVTVTVTLSAKTYATAAELAAEVAGRLNGAQAVRDAGSSVSVTEAGGLLTFISARYGSASRVVLSGNAAATLVGGAPTATDGVDVAGLIAGVAATGSGQVLTGATGSVAEGLKLTIAGGALGARGSLRYTEGIATRLDRVLTSLLDDEGIVDAKTDGVQKSIAALDRRKQALEDRLERVEAAYLAQYVALDARIAQLSATSTYLTQQLANLPKPTQDE